MLAGLAHRLEQPVEVLRCARRPTGRWRPRSIESSGLGTTSSGSTSKRVPRPSQCSQAPYGELNEKLRGASSSKRRAALRAGEVLAERERLAPRRPPRPPGDDLDLGDALGQPQRRLEGVGEPALDALALHEAVDDDLDRVLLVAGEVDLLGELVQLAVDPGPGEALGGEVGEQRLVGALAAPHDRRQHLEAGALGQLEDAVDDLLRGLADDDRAVVGAVRHADAGVQQPQVVVDLGDRADRRAGVARGRLLVDRDGRRQALDEVDVGLVHLARGTGGRRPTATRRSGAGPRRRSCRTPATTCPSPRGR